ncbi:MAG: arsenic transporter [Kofleriaceae bacterium]
MVIAVVVTSIALMLIRPRGIQEVWWAGSGAVILVATNLVPLRLACQAVSSGLDVYTFLAGMMLMCGLAQELGVFDWMAALAVRSARGSSVRLFTSVYVVGTIVTIFMSNDATAVVLTPAVLVVVRQAKAPPLAYLFVCAMIANAASFVLPISNPANLVVFHGGMPPLGRWLAWFAIPSLLSIATTYAALRFVFRRELRVSLEAEVAIRPRTRGVTWCLGGLAFVVAVLLAASAYDLDLGVPTLLAAGLVVVVMGRRERIGARTLVRAISWSTLVLVAALFVMVSSVERIGAIGLAAEGLQKMGSMPAAPAVALTGATVSVANNLVNNLPLGLIAGAAVQQAHPTSLVTRSILIGVDLGPNLSVTGSLATILWLLALQKERIRVGAWSFLRVGVVVMPIALCASLAGLLLAHLFTGS